MGEGGREEKGEEVDCEERRLEREGGRAEQRGGEGITRKGNTSLRQVGWKWGMEEKRRDGRGENRSEERRRWDERRRDVRGWEWA